VADLLTGTSPDAANTGYCSQLGDQPYKVPQSDCDSQADKKTKNETPPPAYKLLRFEEDYSYLKDPERHADLWDTIKYIPLWRCENRYLSLGGELRQRFEFVHNPVASVLAKSAGRQP
jgi:hypothetical protein